MNPSRQIRPAVPESLPESDRIAFAVYDLLAAEVRDRGWTLLVRLVGFGADRRAVLELRRGVSPNVRALKEDAVWRGAEGLWTIPGRGPESVATADALAVAVRARVAEGHSERFRPVERTPKQKNLHGASARVVTAPRSLMHLSRDTHDRGDDEYMD